MHKKILKFKSKIPSVWKFWFLCILFFSACTPNKPIDIDERCKITSFLNQFLFVEGAVFSLFGDKPLSVILIFTGNQEILEPLSGEELKNAIFVDDTICDTWQTWKRFSDKLPFKNFIFAERPCLRDPHHVLYFLMNVKRVQEILYQHKDEFEAITGIHFHNIHQIIQEFKNPESAFWNKVLVDHYLSGLLFGYGDENITYFLSQMNNQKGCNQFSDEFDPSAVPTKFPIPIFAISSKDKTSDRYREQRKAIQNKYHNKDFIDVTLKRLLE